MFQKTTRIEFSRRLFSTLILLAITSLQTSMASAQTQGCDDIFFLESDTTWRGLAETPGSTARLAVDLPSTGLLVAEASLSNAHTSSSMLEAERDTCGGVPASFAVVERTTSRLLLAVTEPGRLLLSVSSVDPRHALGEYRVFTRLVALTSLTDSTDMPLGSLDSPWSRVTRTRLVDAHAQLIAERVTLDLLRHVNKTEIEVIDPNPAGLYGYGANKTEIEVIDPNPAGLHGQGALEPGAAWLDAAWLVPERRAFKTEIEVIDPNPAGLRAESRLIERSFPLTLPLAGAATATGADDTLIQHLAQAFTRGIAERAAHQPGIATLLGACGTRPGDDHHDALTCATTIDVGQARSGTLSTDWDDDADAFGFTVHEISTVEIRARGDAAMSGALYDRSGRRLSARAAEGDDIQMIERLEPGSYVVRVEALNPRPATYSLTVLAVDG